jgi:hypothetical protein
MRQQRHLVQAFGLVVAERERILAVPEEMG